MFYAASTARGIASFGLSRMGVTLLDLVKRNMQIDPAKFKIMSGFVILLKDKELRGSLGAGCQRLLDTVHRVHANLASTSTSRNSILILLDLRMLPSIRI